MFQFFSRLVSKNKSDQGTFKIDGNVYENATLQLIDENLSLEFIPKGKTNHKTISISPLKLSNLAFKDSTISFIFDNSKHSFTANNLSDLYSRLSLMVSYKPLFIANNVLYYIFDSSSRMFKVHDEPVCLEITSELPNCIRISDSSKIIHLEVITTEIQYYVDQANYSFVWSVFVSDQFKTFCIKFSENILFLEFRSKFLDCSYRSNYSQENDQSNVINKIYSNIGEYNVTATNDECDDKWYEYEEEKDIKEVSNELKSIKDGNKNLVIGNDLCFITRGESLGIFGIENDEIKFKTQIKNAVKDPLKIITHNGENNLLIIEKDLKDSLSRMDLHRGEVIERWEIGKAMNDCFDSLKTDNNGTLVGLSDYSIFRIDPRTKEKVVEKKDYKTKNEFACGMAANTGGLAVASKKGDLRLYDKIGKRAKSLIPGFGDEIIGIDTSSDGGLVLCTCKSYILLFEVQANYSKHSSAVPHRLQLQPQHLGLINEEVSFTPAKFDKNDTLIISSTGKFIVKWRVTDVLARTTYNYYLKLLGDRVVDENFIMNGKEIIVATENDLRKINESELRRPAPGPTI